MPSNRTARNIREIDSARARTGECCAAYTLRVLAGPQAGDGVGSSCTAPVGIEGALPFAFLRLFTVCSALLLLSYAFFAAFAAAAAWFLVRSIYETATLFDILCSENALAITDKFCVHRTRINQCANLIYIARATGHMSAFLKE